MSERTVSKLRPKKPLVSSLDDTVLSVCQMLASKRSDASLIADATSGGLAGIITEVDITRRVVSKQLDPSTTTIGSVMTPNPTCCQQSDPAMTALTIMVTNHFRHLPVLDAGDGSIVGILDIAKCLNDAMSNLERSYKKKNPNAEVLKSLGELGGQGGNSSQAAAIAALTQMMMNSAGSGEEALPTLRSLLARSPTTMVHPGTNVYEVGLIMSEARKASLIVDADSGELLGIFGFKDMMTRVVAKELPLELTDVTSVMTSSPEAVSPDLTVLEAMQIMHDDHIKSLPVVEQLPDGSSRVLGIVDILDVILACGGKDGWRSIFDTAMEVSDDMSDSGSVVSYGARSARGGHSSVVGGRSSRGTSSSGSTPLGSLNEREERSVLKLRPKKPLVSEPDDTVLNVCQMLATKRSDASLIAGSNGGLAGIVTDVDITRRVVAKSLEPSTTIISTVMTVNPTCVSLSDPAMNALTIMVENHFRHLPVLDDDGAIVGLLDIAKCLNDAIGRLERSSKKTAGMDVNAMAQMATTLQSVGGNGNNAAQKEAMQLLLSTMMSSLSSDNASPTLRSILANQPASTVPPTLNVREVGVMMAETRKAALVVDEHNELVGIFGFKDMMTRVVAKELVMESTMVSDVMTPSPDTVGPDITVLEALQVMHDGKFLTLPVCETDGQVVGIVSVIDLVYACGGKDGGWKKLFENAMDVSDDDSLSQNGGSLTSYALPKSSPRNNRGYNGGSGGASVQFSQSLQQPKGITKHNVSSSSTATTEFLFKVTTTKGVTHRIKCKPKLRILMREVAEKLCVNVDTTKLTLKYIDDEGDTILISSDENLVEGIDMAKSAGNNLLKITVQGGDDLASALQNVDNTLVLAGAGVVGLTVLLLLVMAMKPSRQSRIL